MADRRRIVTWVLCSFLVLTVLAAIVLLSSPRWTPVEQTLGDGTTLRIEGITFGTNHVFTKHPIREKIRGVLPDRLKPLLGKGSFAGRIQTASDSLMLWTTRTDPTGRMPRPGAVATLTFSFPRDERHYAVDEHGCRVLSHYRRSTTAAGTPLTGVTFEAFPRAARHFDYVICDNSGTVIGNLKVANLFATNRQRWLPDKVPVTKTNAGLIAELRGFWWSAGSSRIFTDIRLPLLQDVESWEKGPVWISDSAGNRTRFESLCTNEPVWKIEADFFRHARAQFRPDETWLITNVAVPRLGEDISLQKTNMLQGCVVAVQSFQGFGYDNALGNSSPDDTVEIPPKPPTLTLWGKHGGNEVRILVRARDDSGRKLVTMSQEDRSVGYARYATQWQQKFSIYPYLDSRSMDIEVLVQRPAKFEFFVDPQATDRSMYKR